jgi:hypothetical protein
MPSRGIAVTIDDAIYSSYDLIARHIHAEIYASSAKLVLLRQLNAQLTGNPSSRLGYTVDAGHRARNRLGITSLAFLKN